MSARMDDWNEQEAQVIGSLERLAENTPVRGTARASAGRQQFLAEAARLSLDARPAVSAEPKARHKEWMHLKFFQKEKMHMPTLVTILVIMMMALGGTGATVFAAQSSLPGDALYNIKTAGEAVESGFTVREQSRLMLALRLSDERIAEMAGLVNGGRQIPDDLGERWQAQVERALGLSAEMNDMDLENALERVREHLREQDRVLSGFSEQERIREMIQERLNQVEAGLEDPQGFREHRHQHRAPVQGGYPVTTDPVPSGTSTPGSGFGPGPGACADCTPEGGQHLRMTGTATPGGHVYGPGTCETCTPEGGHNPWTTGTPTPGSSYGPGPGHEAEHTPQSPGPGPAQPAPDGGGGPSSGGGTSGGSEHHEEPGGSGGSGEHHEESGGGGHR